MPVGNPSGYEGLAMQGINKARAQQAARAGSMNGYEGLAMQGINKARAQQGARRASPADLSAINNNLRNFGSRRAGGGAGAAIGGVNSSGYGPAYNIKTRKPVAPRMGMSDTQRKMINNNLRNFGGPRKASPADLSAINNNLRNFGSPSPGGGGAAAGRGGGGGARTGGGKGKGKGGAGVGTGKGSGAPSPKAPTKTPVADDAIKKGKQLFGNINKRTAIAIGAGAIGMGALLRGRERRGTSSGSQGMYRY